MIVLTAFQTDIHGSCRFTIETEGTARITRDPVAAAKILFQLGVPEPLYLIDHARRWGSVEILAPESRH